MRMHMRLLTNPGPMDRDTTPSASMPVDPVAEPAQLPLIPTFVLFYLAAVALLAWRLGSRPNFAYNWEPYTARGLIDFVAHPTRDVFRMNDGLMTDSGRTFTVVGPDWLGFQILGQSWLGLRLPIVLISALAVPLTWAFGRRLYSDAVGVTAGVLLMTSPVYLLYGRTGTLVGMSLAPAMLSSLLLWQCVRKSDRHWWLWLALFQLALVLNSYFYSPIRLLWPIAAVLFAIEFVLRGSSRARFITSLVATILILPMALTVLLPGGPRSPDYAVEEYFFARGEQVFHLREVPNGISPFLRGLAPEERAQIADESTNQQLKLLVRQNVNDLAELLIDRNTRPAITDFWNPHGRLYPRLLTPFFAIGMVWLVVRFPFDPRARLMTALFWGLSTPLVLTSQVHIGRLIFVLPLLALICATPAQLIVGMLGRWHAAHRYPGLQHWGPVVIGLLIALVGAGHGMAEWQTTFPQPHMSVVADRIVTLTEPPSTQQFVYVFGDLSGYAIESLRVAELEMELPGYFRFKDLSTGSERGTGSVSLLYGGVIPLLARPESIPGYCTNRYLVEPEVLNQFHEESDAAARKTCGQPLRFEVLDV
jgi:hypothetical protein